MKKKYCTLAVAALAFAGLSATAVGSSLTTQGTAAQQSSLVSESPVVASVEMTEWNFKSIKEDQNFYLNEDGQIVICFDEYEVAPGYMGLVQFTIDNSVVSDILKTDR